MMGVWDPKDKTTALSQIKKAIGARYQGFKPWVVWCYPGILLILIFFIFVLLSGCSTMKWPWEKNIKAQEKEFICTKIDCGDEDIDQLVADEQNTIACIKLQPECNLDQEN